MKLKRRYIFCESTGTFLVDKDRLVFEMGDNKEEYDFTPYGEGTYVGSEHSGPYDFIADAHRDSNGILWVEVMCFVPTTFSPGVEEWEDVADGEYYMEG